MALAKKCDACKTFFDFDKDETKPNGIVLAWMNENSQVSRTIEKKELCPKCIKKVKDILDIKED